MKLKRKRRSFQLLEILIALTLIVVCVIPLMQTFVQMHIEQKEEKRLVDANELMRDIHAKITEDLFAHRITWQEVETRMEKKVEDPNLVKRAKKLNFQASYQFTPEAQKGDDKSTHHLVDIMIKVVDLKDPKYIIFTHYYAYIRSPA